MSEVAKTNDRNRYEIVVSAKKSPVINKRCREFQHDNPQNKTPKLSEYESPRLWQLMDQKLAKQTEMITTQIAAQFNNKLIEFEKKIMSNSRKILFHN